MTSVSDASGDGIAVIGEVLTLAGTRLDAPDLGVTVGGVAAAVLERGVDSATVRVPPGSPVGDVPLIASDSRGSSASVPIRVRRLAFASNFTDLSLSVLEVNGLEVTAIGEIAIDVPPGPFAVELTPDGATAVVACSIAFLPAAIVDALAPGAPAGDSVALVDTATGAVTAVLTTGSSSKPTGIVVSPDGAFAYVTNYATSTISVIDLAARSLVDTIAVPRQPEEIAIRADGAVLLVASDGGTASTIDTATRQVLGTVETGGNDPSGVAFSPDGRIGYVTNSFTDPTLGEDGTLTLLDLTDPASPVFGSTIANGIGPTPYDVQVSPDGRLALVTNLNVIFEPLMIGAGSVSILDFAANPPSVATLAVGTAPVHAAIAASGDLALVGNGLGQTISVLDLASRTVHATLPLGTTIGPADVAIQP